MELCPRFAPAASPEFDDWFAGELDALGADVAEVVGSSFHALVLGGGYGRGEGGVIRRGGHERPYNDVDLFLFVDGRRRVRAEALHEVAARYHRRLGVDVDISRPYHVAEIAAWEPTLMWFELATGHHVVRGPARLLQQLCPDDVKGPPPATESLRLLLNRGAGLLWALRIARGLETAPDADFVRRNYHKCALACGDALLLAARAYGPFATRVAQLSALHAAHTGHPGTRILARYMDARRFKLTPDALPDAAPTEDVLMALARDWGEVLLDVERTRTGIRWSSFETYAGWRGLREPRASAGLRRVVHAAKHLGEGRVEWRHPRERLYRELPELLGLGASPIRDWPARSAEFLDRWRAAH